MPASMYGNPVRPSAPGSEPRVRPITLVVGQRTHRLDELVMHRVRAVPQHIRVELPPDHLVAERGEALAFAAAAIERGLDHGAGMQRPCLEVRRDPAGAVEVRAIPRGVVAVEPPIDEAFQPSQCRFLAGLGQGGRPSERQRLGRRGDPCGAARIADAGCHRSRLCDPYARIWCEDPVGGAVAFAHRAWSDHVVRADPLPGMPGRQQRGRHPVVSGAPVGGMVGCGHNGVGADLLAQGGNDFRGSPRANHDRNPRVPQGVHIGEDPFDAAGGVPVEQRAVEQRAVEHEQNNDAAATCAAQLRGVRECLVVMGAEIAPQPQHDVGRGAPVFVAHRAILAVPRTKQGCAAARPVTHHRNRSDCSERAVARSGLQRQRAPRRCSSASCWSSTKP